MNHKAALSSYKEGAKKLIKQLNDWTISSQEAVKQYQNAKQMAMEEDCITMEEWKGIDELFMVEHWDVQTMERN